MTPCEEQIRAVINRDGFITIEDFMSRAVTHYYAGRDPFGRGGDFTTAPEISQMFGELLGAWAADLWLRLGSPEAFILAEGGPGRGTLMADALRATRKVAGFHEAMQLVLLETSPALRARQAEALKDYNPHWIAALDDMPEDKPVIFLSNELLDALPIRQAVFTQGQWRERVIRLGSSDDLVFSAGMPVVLDRAGTEGDIFEYAPVRETFIDDLGAMIKKRRGGALLIDYGHERSALGDTLQAMKAHQFVPVLEGIGEADLTSHVDFEVLVDKAKAQGLSVNLATQGRFLEALGLHVRAAQLRNAGAKGVDDAVRRLSAPDAMGNLFKVMELSCL